LVRGWWRRRSGMDRCGTCQAPLFVSQRLSWDPEGVISIVGSPHNRMVFFESECIDQIFRGIEDLIGSPIEHIVIESRARETRRYIEKIYPGEEVYYERVRDETLSQKEREEAKEHIRALTQSIIDIGKVYGYGDTRMSDLWERDYPYPWRVQVTRDPYSLLFTVADNLGSVEACEGRDMWAGYQEIGENTYRIEVYEGEHPVGLKERLQRKKYGLKPGDIGYARCSECGLPLEVSRHRWDLERGVILDPGTGRRRAFFGPLSVDAIFHDLEEELGEYIPEKVIEAMRRYCRVAWAGEEWRRDADTFREMIALRGLGNLTSFRGDREHLEVLVQNPALHLPLVGAIQALVELAYRAEGSNVDWELKEDGDLGVDVRLKR